MEKAFKHSQTNNNWQTPIDEIDAAARILDPFFSWVQDKQGRDLLLRCAGSEQFEGQHSGAAAESNVLGGMQHEVCSKPPYGMFLKDYRITEW